MSIAQELTRIGTAKADIRSAINAKGGQVSSDALIDTFAEAISSLPSGGGGMVQNLATSNTTVISSYDKETGVIKGYSLGASNSVNAVYMLDRMSRTPIKLKWTSWSATEIQLEEPIDLSNIVGSTCIWTERNSTVRSPKFIINGDLPVPEFGTIYFTDPYHDGEKIYSYDFASASEFNTAVTGGNGSRNKDIYNAKFNNIPGYAYTYVSDPQILGFQIGSSITSLPDKFCRFYQCMDQPLVIPSSVTSIGRNALEGCTVFNSPIIIEGSLTIGDNFMMNCDSFCQNLDLSKVTAIGDNFMNNCPSMKCMLYLGSMDLSSKVNFMKDCVSQSTICVGNTISPTDSGTLSVSANDYLRYSTGTDLGGGYWDVWYDSLSDSSSLPYRKKHSQLQSITIDASITPNCLEIGLKYAGLNTFTVFWGDGTFEVIKTAAASAGGFFEHKYAKPGSYLITFAQATGATYKSSLGFLGLYGKNNDGEWSLPGHNTHSDYTQVVMSISLGGTMSGRIDWGTQNTPIWLITYI